jgi:hypothetical protein
MHFCTFRILQNKKQTYVITLPHLICCCLLHPSQCIQQILMTYRLIPNHNITESKLVYAGVFIHFNSWTKESQFISEAAAFLSLSLQMLVQYLDQATALPIH